MSRRPSFLNPFAHAARRKGEEVADHDLLSPLDPGPSCRAVHPTPSTPDAPARTYASVGVQTGLDDFAVSCGASRKGSLSKLKGAGRVLRPQNVFRKFVGLWNYKRGYVSSTDRDAESPPVSPNQPVEAARTAPPRPPRPAPLDVEFLEMVGNCVNLFKDVASRSQFSSDSEVVSVVVVAPRPTRNTGQFPKVTTAAPVPSFCAEVHDDPQPAPSPLHDSPASLSPSPPLSLSPSPSHDDRPPAFTIGIAPGPRLPLPPVQTFWPVLQRNNLHVPPERVAKWVTGGILGAGGFGRVYLVYNTTTRAQCAMKVVQHAGRMSKSSCQGLINELRVLSILGAEPDAMPFLLQPYLADSLWAWRSTAGYLHILTDACTGGNLNVYKGKLGFDSLVLVSAEMILGLSHLHRHGIVHHDLKPHNVLVNPAGHCVIADYGGTRFLNTEGRLVRHSDTSAIMTTAFAAPELLVNVEEGTLREYDERVDYWSLGATLVSMIMEDEFLPGTSDIHFMGFRVQKIRARMMKLQTPLVLHQFIMDLLQMDPELRPKDPGIREHPFFENVNWDDVLKGQYIAIPSVMEVGPTGYGWDYDTPKVHKTRDTPVTFLRELRRDRLSLPVDDNFDVENHHATLINAL
ncbi:kinase-like domain-containing protein [Daedaleopsis nitida]|nr:kinase-like domain-containing protein [Daedaleopsis nitida]